MSVRLTLWGRGAENFSLDAPGSSANPVIAFKGVRVGDFGGRSLSMMSGSSMMVEPDIPEAHALRGWYDDGGVAQSFTTYNSAGGGGAGGNAGGSMQAKDFKHIGEAKDAMFGTNEEPDWFAVRAQLVYVKKETISYPACGTCNKKMHLEDDSSWRCEKCEKNYDAPTYRCASLPLLLLHSKLTSLRCQLRTFRTICRLYWLLLLFMLRRCRKSHPRQKCR